MNQPLYRIGLDVGSTTAKIAVLDNENNLVYSRYKRHNAHIWQLISTYFDELQDLVGNAKTAICVTGSVGMAVAKQLNSVFVQEVVAATAFAKKLYPQAKTLIDIGGEDAKVVFFNKENMELRMNGNCAGGTGAFLDQMSVLMGTDNMGMNDMAMNATDLYPMAARCGVFAKTDIQNLMSRNLPKENIAASIFHSVAVQTVVTLSHGCDFQTPILLCGGPLTFLPSLRKAFANYLKLDADKDFIITENSNIIPAMGCAIRASEIKGKDEGENEDGENGFTSLAELKDKLSKPKKTNRKDTQKSLFNDEKEHSEWIKSKEKYATEVHQLEKGKVKIVIGIDSGSTTTKLVALKVSDNKENKDYNSNARPEVVFTDYRMNLGNPITAVTEALNALKAKAEENGSDIEIVGSCSTGYGEELIKTAFNLNDSVIETIAHYRAASCLMPDVSFILDIGGQDMKAIFVENGAIVRMELNEACSSGCGTFIQTFANSLGYNIEDFSKIACTAKEPCDLGTRCTVFMNSKVKQVLLEGASVADISAGISFSVVKNCLYKVLKLRNSDSLGKQIVVQGGTMRNDAVVRAFEILTGTSVARSNMPELMGAMGCALHAASAIKSHETSVSIDELLSRSTYEARQLQCKGCENHCMVSRYTFADDKKFFSGNKCERVFNNNGNNFKKGENIYEYKYKRVFRDTAPLKKGLRTIGIPRILNMYEEFPFWNTLLKMAGFNVVLSNESTFYKYEKALNSVMADNICFPAKLVHSHINELNCNEEVERILMPYVVYEQKEDHRTPGAFNCPIVSGYSDVIKSVVNLKKPLDAPVINFEDFKLLEKQIIDYLKVLGVKKSVARSSFWSAITAQKAYTIDIKHKAQEILERSQKEGNVTILLAGRPYHSDPLIQHKLSDMITSLGVDVISEDIIRYDNKTNTGDTYLVKQWAYMNRIVKAGQWVAEQNGNVHFVQMTSFGCGPDAFIQDEIRDILKRHNKPFTLLKIDDISNIGSLKLRVRSLVESLKLKDKNEKTDAAPLVQTKVFKKEDVHRKILAPYFTEYLTPIIGPILKVIGYDVEVLPMADQESAELGLQYANNEVCYPATLIVGDIIKALKSGKYDIDNTAVVMSQTGGQCRATNYAGLIKRAMVNNGFKDVPLLTLGVTATADEGVNEQEGFKVPWLKYSKIIVTGILFGDALSEIYNACIVREKQPGIAKLLRKKYINAAEHYLLSNDANGLVRLLKEAAKEFDQYTEVKDVPKVGIVGEIFLKFNPFSHEFIERHIIAKGIEVVPPLLAPFFLQEFVNAEARKKLRLSSSKMPNFVLHTIYQTIIGERIKAINKAAGNFRYFRPFTNIYNDSKEVNGIVSLAAQFGEGWLLPSDIISYLRDGVKNVISLQPFGCIANHVVSKGIEKKLHKLYPQLNLLSLDFDSGVSSVNVTNRLLLFLDSIAV